MKRYFVTASGLVLFTWTALPAAAQSQAWTSRPEDFLIEGKLAGAVFDRGTLPDEKKECVVFLLSPPDAETTAGNIHLKSNRTFDATMRVCDVELTRGH